MKATLEFNMDDPEDQRAMLRCVKSTEMAVALFSIYHNAHRHTETIEQYRDNIEQAIGALNLDELII